MSKIGKMSIDINSVAISIVNNNIINYKGSFSSGTYILPDFIEIIKENDSSLKLLLKDNLSSFSLINIKAQWGLHRSLLNNAITGARQLFEKKLRIEGIGFKARLEDKKILFSLGFSYIRDKNDPSKKLPQKREVYVLPDNISVEIDKAGQLLHFKSSDKELLGAVCSNIRSLRPPEPYKGKGVRYDNEIINRKAGKAKS